MFDLRKYLDDTRLWKSSRKCTLREILLNESVLKKEDAEILKELLLNEQNVIKRLFDSLHPKAMCGDDVERLRIKEEGGEANKTADVYVFHSDIDDPIYLVECKYRYLLSKNIAQKRRMREIFEDLTGKFTKSSTFLEKQGRAISSKYFVVTNINVAPILRSELEDYCMEAGVNMIYVVDNNRLYEYLHKLGVELVKETR